MMLLSEATNIILDALRETLPSEDKEEEKILEGKDDEKIYRFYRPKE